MIDDVSMSLPDINIILNTCKTKLALEQVGIIVDKISEFYDKQNTVGHLSDNYLIKREFL